VQHLDNIPGIESRIAALKGKLRAREGKKEFTENCAMLRAEIEGLEARLAEKRAAVASEEKSG
jgi:hypothetical protein